MLKNLDSNFTLIQPKLLAPQSISSKFSKIWQAVLWGVKFDKIKIALAKKKKFVKIFDLMNLTYKIELLAPIFYGYPAS